MVLEEEFVVESSEEEEEEEVVDEFPGEKPSLPSCGLADTTSTLIYE